MCTVTDHHVIQMEQGIISPDIEKFVQTTMFESIRSLVQKLFDDKQSLKSDGIYSPEDYYALCQTSPKRIEWLAKRNGFLSGFAPPEFFDCDRGDVISGFKNHVFKLKPGCNPSAALKAMRQGLSILNCGAVCSLAFHETIQKFLWSKEEGDARFDELFKATGNNPLCICTGHYGNGSMTPFVLAVDPKQFKDGDLVHLTGPAASFVKHPIGRMGGHVVVHYQGRFYGQDMPVEGLTFEGLEQLLVEEFNKKGRNPLLTKMIDENWRSNLFTNIDNTMQLWDFYRDKTTTLDQYRAEGSQNLRGATFNYKGLIFAKILPISSLQTHIGSIKYIYK